MDIVDSQVHIGPGRIEETVAAMDALGIKSLLIDEFWMRGTEPGYSVPHGAFRPISPTAELAAWRYPDRFSYLVRIDRRDAEMRSIIRLARDAAYARALRVVPGMYQSDIAAFGAGEYDEVFAAAAECGLPMFVFIPGNTAMLARYAEKFPDLRIIIDHCGTLSNVMRKFVARGDDDSNGEAGESEGQQMDLTTMFDQVLRLSDRPNVALKWAHAPAMFEVPGFPGEALRPLLRRALNSFGAERIMWASDITANLTGETWAELLFSVVSNPDLSDNERESVLGRTARTWLNWSG